MGSLCFLTISAVHHPSLIPSSHEKSLWPGKLPPRQAKAAGSDSPTTQRISTPHSYWPQKKTHEGIYKMRRNQEAQQLTLVKKQGVPHRGTGQDDATEISSQKARITRKTMDHYEPAKLQRQTRPGPWTGKLPGTTAYPAE